MGKALIAASTHAVKNGRIRQRRVLERVPIQVGAFLAITEGKQHSMYIKYAP